MMSLRTLAWALFLLVFLQPLKGGRALCLTHRICQFPPLLRMLSLFWETLPGSVILLFHFLWNPLSPCLQLFPGSSLGCSAGRCRERNQEKGWGAASLSLDTFTLKCVSQCSFFYMRIWGRDWVARAHTVTPVPWYVYGGVTASSACHLVAGSLIVCTTGLCALG